MKRAALVLGAIVALAASGVARAEDVLALNPGGWSVEPGERDYGGVTFLAPDGVSAAHIDHYSHNDDIQDLAETAGRRSRPSGADTVSWQDVQPLSDTKGYVSGGGWDDEGIRSIGMGVGLPHRHGGTLTCWVRFPAGREAPAFASTFIAGCVEAANRGDMVYVDEKQRIAAREAIAKAGPVKAGTGQAIEAILLDEYYISGVGGMILPDYRPVVLFKGGVACRLFEMPVEDLDPAALQAAQPDDVTRWTRSGNEYVFQWPGDSDPTRITTDYERPKVYGQNHRLDGYWSRLGGGGNTALGGDTMVAVSNGFRFFADGRFSTDQAASASAPGVFTGSTSADAGRYTINGSTLELIYGDGRVERTSIFHSGGESPVLWIGGDSFTD